MYAVYATAAAAAAALVVVVLVEQHCSSHLCCHPCASVGASGLVAEYRTRNFHVAGANLAQAICKQS